MISLTRKITAALAASTMLFSAPAFAEEAAAGAIASTEVASPTEATATGPALWKVADEDTTVYLFGTVHALPEGIEWLDGPIADAFAASDTIVTEIKMDDSMAAEMQALVMSKGMLPADTTLRSLLDEDQLATFDGAMTKLGLPVEAFDRFEPWYAGMMLTMLPLMQQGYAPDSGVEMVLLRQAGERQKGALETIDFQIGVFDGLPQESQVKFLVDAAANTDEVKNQLDAMLAEWIEGDADQLAELLNEGMEDKTLAEALLYNRNANWAEWIDDRMDDPGTVFIAVGAGHLAGTKSVQDLLTGRGIEVVRVR